MRIQASRRFIVWKRISNLFSYIPIGGVGLLLIFGNCVSIEASCFQSLPSVINARGAAQVNEGSVDLEIGKPIKRELKGGEVHTYKVTLSINQFLRVAVDQRYNSLVVRLFGPDSKLIAEVGYPKGIQGPELVSVISDAAGSYRLEVRSAETALLAGRYGIKIEEMRSAIPQDTVRIAAERGFSQAEQLRLQGTAESLRKAIPKYEEILPLFRTTGDRRGEALALKNIGRVYHILGDMQKALGYYSQALSIFSSTGDRRGVPLALVNIGIVYFSLGDMQKALGYYSQALGIFRTTGDRRGVPGTLNNLGSVYLSLGEKQKALEYYNQALPIFRSTGDRWEEVIVLGSIGEAYNLLGDMQKALGYYSQALAISRTTGDRRGKASTLHDIGVAYYSLGEIRKALDHLNQALRIFRSTYDRPGEASTLHDIGVAYYSLGEMQKAHDTHTQSLLLSRAVGNLNLEARNLYGIARVKLHQGDFLQACSNVESALAIIESLRVKVASPELRASYFASVQQYYGFYIDLLMQLHRLEPKQNYDTLALQASDRARARTLLEMLIESRADIRQGVDPALLERERALQHLLEAKADRQTRLLSGRYTEGQAAELKKEIEQLLSQYQEVQSQIRASSPRYAALTQPQPLTFNQIQQEVLDADTLLLEYALGDEHSYLWAVTSDSIASFTLPKREEVEKAARHVYDLLTARNRREQGLSSAQREARVKQGESDYNRAVAELSRMILGPAAAYLGKKRLLVVGDGALNYIPFAALPVPATAASSPDKKGGARTNTSLAQARQNLLIAEHEIISLPSASSIAVLRKELAGRKPAPKAAVVLADPVFDANDARVRPSASVRAHNNAATGGQQADNAGGSSDNITKELSELALTRSANEVGLTDRGELPRLPFSRQEAETIYALTSQAGMQQAGTRLALNFEASRETAVSPDLGQYRIIHFATHGLLNNEHPELSGIVLSLVDRQGKPQNGFLRLYDVYNMSLTADLAVLSACQTALGKQIRGEGLIGLTRGFMYAGAVRVMASLWRVEDEATAEMMKNFYERMVREGQRPAAALRAAQVWMQRQKRWRSPYYWAGFILQGEWK